MKILILGSGGREHALAWRLKRNGHQLFSAPGNPGTAREGQNYPRTDYLALAQELQPDLTLVGPEAPLVAGVVDQFKTANLKIVGPNRQNAQLEASKTFSKRFMEEAQIPTARSTQVDSIEAGIKALKNFPLPVVIKADGLAAGKGVIIAQTLEEAESAIKALGPKLVIEEFLEGEEVSFIALCDGRSILALEPTQDHKAVHDNDQGPNTGGMGAYCDSKILTPAQSKQILKTIIEPVVERTRFTGFLYAGLMMTNEGPKTLEFNVRLGDPETQALMYRMDSDFGEVLLAAAEGRLDQAKLHWKPEPSVAIVLAAHGYPGTVRTGDEIHGIDEVADAVVYQAGTKQENGKLLTNGGRVLAVTSSGPTLDAAIRNAYSAAENIHFQGCHYRSDIGKKGLKRWSVALGREPVMRFDLDEVEVWGPRLSRQFGSGIHSLAEGIRAARPQTLEDSASALFSLFSKKDFVGTVSTWIAAQMVAAYHGARYTPKDVLNVKKEGLRILSATARRKVLERRFEQHPEWQSVRSRLSPAVAQVAPGREGFVYAGLSRTHLIKSHDVIQKGPEFDRHVISHVFKDLAEPAAYGEPSLVVLSIPGSDALRAANEPPSGDPEVPSLVGEIAQLWSYWLGYPNDLDYVGFTTCELRFSQDIPPRWIEAIEVGGFEEVGPE